ncbi:hypothetical protein EJ04DRAFT_567184 [Polyplosphaeria fusca]|uniref:C2H2-type domain-containing protein n=1 Tax=Polyplosphaeria fusca TaxID=682080 RepID=A0A9P4QU98_9PLEO|nr:hypothetical protein EJ04DRAFT_567184 [Polyplosphaeria fusca]
MTPNYFPEAGIALIGHDDHLFPSSTCHSPPALVYTESLHHMNSLPSVTEAGNGLYPQPNEYRPMPYPSHSFWPPHPPTMAHAYPSTYLPLAGLTSQQTLPQDSTLLPNSMMGPRPSRSPSGSSSNGLGIPSNSLSDRSPPSLSRSLSPSSPDLRAYGYPNKNGTWSCAYPGCTSRAVFTRGCDLRKHHKRHTKSFFCRHEGCPQATGGGFSSKKDLARHEAKHNPGVLCDWEGCDRVFSRVDNMRDHVKRIHLKASRNGKTTSNA